MAILALLTVVALPAFLHYSDIGWLGRALAQATPLVVLGATVVFVIGLLYRYGPDRKAALKRWVSYGAVFATLAWLLVSVLLSIYVSRFADFNQTYGSLGAIVGLMFWLYASAFVVLLGAELNAEMELQTEQDTTTGRTASDGRARRLCRRQRGLTRAGTAGAAPGDGSSSQLLRSESVSTFVRLVPAAGPKLRRRPQPTARRPDDPSG